MRQTTVDMLLSGLTAAGREAGGFCLIAGTTASGKSMLALRLAERTDGVIINADSMQLYRSLPILTAQPDAEARARVPHLLYGILDDADKSSVAAWQVLATRAIRDVQPRFAIVTGGTGFYLEALLEGLPDLPATPPELRATSTQRLEALGLSGLALELHERDPLLAARGLPRDPQRLLRAWEVLELSGQSIVTFWDRPRRRPELPACAGGLALVPPPALTARRIEARVDAMLAAGVVHEVEAWLRRPTAAGSALAKADGVKEFGAYVQGLTSLAAAREATIVKVRRYAKRQRTWLRHRLPDVMEAVPDPGDAIVDRSR